MGYHSMKKLVVVLIVLGVSYCLYLIVSQWFLIRFMEDSNLRSACIETRWLEMVKTVAEKDLSPEVRLQKINLLVSGRAEYLCFSLKARAEALRRELPEEYGVALRIQKSSWAVGKRAMDLTSRQPTNELSR
jgi:hypothetical protein